MSYLLALLPALTVLDALLVVRLPVWAGALIGLAVALVQFSLSGGDPVRWDAGAALLLGAVMVVLPGLGLNGIIRLRGVHVRLAAWVQAVPLSVPWKTCLLVLGVGPALESLTGFGISLLVTVPILMSLSPPAVAVRQALRIRPARSARAGRAGDPPASRARAGGRRSGSPPASAPSSMPWPAGGPPCSHR